MDSRSGTITINGCLFEECTSQGSGGALSFWSDRSSDVLSATISNSDFIQCSTDYRGGAISCKTDSGTISLTLSSLVFIATAISSTFGSLPYS